MWGRVIRLEVSGANGLILATDELRVDFNYMHEWGRNDLCSVQVFNLSRETFKSLTTNKALTIKLSAGHRDVVGELPVILEGHINNVWGQKVVPNHITHLYCVPKALYLAAANVPVPAAKRDSTLRSHLTSVASAMGLTPPKFIGLADSIGELPVGSRTPDTTIYNELHTLGKQFHVKIRIIDEQMTVTGDAGIPGVIESARDDPNANTFALDTLYLRGTPKLTNSQIQIPYALSPHILSGHILDIGVASEAHTVASVADVSGLGANLNRDGGIVDYATSNLYMVMKVEHTGSAFSKQWHSNIIANTYRINTKGAI